MLVNLTSPVLVTTNLKNTSLFSVVSGPLAEFASSQVSLPSTETYFLTSILGFFEPFGGGSDSFLFLTSTSSVFS